MRCYKNADGGEKLRKASETQVFLAFLNTVIVVE